MSTKGVDGNTIPHPTEKLAKEKINKYFPDNMIIDRYDDTDLNDLAEDVGDLILQRWLGKDLSELIQERKG